MAQSAPIGSQAAPLSIPAILQNPRSKTQIQIQAFNAQQRESREAKRAASSASHDEYGIRRKGEGKRTLRRRENNMMVFNPHRRMPTSGDYVPGKEKEDGRAGSNFVLPGGTPRDIRSTTVPSPAPPTSEPLSTAAGQYTLSLKGVRQLLRKRGRRAEVVVGICEKEMRGWVLGVVTVGDGSMAGMGYGQPKVIDPTPMDFESASSISAGNSSSRDPLAELTPQPENLDHGPTRALPAIFSTSPASSPQHLSTVLHSFCTSTTSSSSASEPSSNKPFTNPTNNTKPKSSGHNNAVKKRPAIVELVRSPGHLVWAVADSFERLVVHLLCRYYDLISFSQTLPPLTQPDGTRTPPYRITHILKLSHVNPVQPAAFDLMTPDNTDLDTDTAGGSASEQEIGSGIISGYTTASESEDERVVGAGIQRAQEARGRTEQFGSRPVQIPRTASVDSDWSRAETESILDSESDFSVDEVVWQPNATVGAETSFASTITPVNGTNGRLASTASSTSGESDFGDDADADASDLDSIAGSSMMMDSLIIGNAQQLPGRAAGNNGWTQTAGPEQPFIPSSLPGPYGLLSMSMEQRRMSLGSNAPFVSEFDLPVDLFPARRMGLGTTKDRTEKPTFFEYLYG